MNILHEIKIKINKIISNYVIFNVFFGEKLCINNFKQKYCIMLIKKFKEIIKFHLFYNKI